MSSSELKSAAFKDTTDTYSSTGTDPVTGKAVAQAIAGIASAMVYKGAMTIAITGSGATPTYTLTVTTSSIKTGYVYKVTSVTNSYTGTGTVEDFKAGDAFIAAADLTPTGSSSTYTITYDSSKWTVIPSGDDVDVTKIETSNVGITTEVSGSADGTPITTQGTIKLKLMAGGSTTRTAVAKGSTADREYAVGVDSAGNLAVNVPWTDNDHTTVVTGNNGAAVDTPTTSGTVTTYNVKADLQSYTKDSSAAGTGKLYAVKLDSAGNLAVNVPWTDHTTAVTGSDGITVDDPTTSGSVTTYNVKHSNSVSALTKIPFSERDKIPQKSLKTSITGKTESLTLADSFSEILLF